MTDSGPYRGLSPFGEADAPYFFGRDHDRRVIVANLIASPLTLLYAPSGVGKTSVLLAGVNPAIRQLKREDGTPEFVPVVVRNWSGDGLGAIHEALAHATGGRFGANGTHLAEKLAATATELNATLLLVLDQFEEFMLYHGDAVAPGEVAWELTRAMTDSELPARVLLGMREDSLAMLDRFKGRVPRLFSNYLRLEHLDFASARAAITGPLNEWNMRHPDEVWAVDDELVDAVIEDVASGHVDLGRTGGGATAAKGTPGQVETAFLQLVMTRLWEEERANGSQCLQAATLRKLGGASTLVRTHVDRQMGTLTRRQRNLAAAAFHQLVTPSGTKVAQSASDLAEYADASPTAVTGMLDTLSSGEWWILRRVESSTGPPRYEVFHDVLAEAVLDWRARHEERRRRARMIRIGLLALAVAGVAVASAIVFENQAQTARAQQLASSARERIASEPRAAVADAVKAVDTRADDAIRSTLRMALVQAEADGIGAAPGTRGRVRSLHISRDGKHIVTASSRNRVQVWTLAGGPPTTYDAAGVRTLSFSPDGTRVAAGGDSHEVLVLGGGGGPERLGIGVASEFVRWSPTGGALLIGSDDWATLWDLDSGRSTVIGGGNGGQFSPGGTRVATSDDHGVARVFGLDGKPLGRPLAGRAEVKGMAFTPGGRRVVVVRTDGSINVSGARGCGPAGGAKLDVKRAEFSADASQVALMTPDGVSVVDVATCTRTALASPQQFPPFFIAISQDGSTVVAASEDGAARVWDVASRTLVATLLGDWHDEARINMRRAAGGGDVVVTASDAGGVQSWWLAGIPAARMAVPVGSALAVTLDRDGALIAATSDGVRSMALRGDESIQTLGDPLPTGQATFSADGAVVAAQDVLGNLRVRRTAGGAWTDLGAVDDVQGLALNDDGSRLATTHSGGLVRVWDTARGSEIASVHNAGKEQAAAFSGADLAVAGRRLAIYGLPGGERRQLNGGTLNDDVPADRPVIAAQGTRIAAAASGGPATVRDLADDASTHKLVGARGVRAMAFAPGGAVVATAGEDGLRLWDTRTGRALITFAARPFGAVAFSRDGRRIIAGDADGAEVFRCDACGSDDEVHATAKEFLERTNPIAIAPNPTPPADRALAGPDRSAFSGGFAPPKANRNATEDLTDAAPPAIALAPVAIPTATPQPDPVAAPAGGR